MRKTFFIFGIFLILLSCESKPKNFKLIELSYSDELKNDFSFVVFKDKNFILRKSKQPVIGGFITDKDFIAFKKSVQQIQNTKSNKSNCNHCQVLSLKIVENNNTIRILQKDNVEKNLLRIVKNIEKLTEKPERKFYLKLIYKFETQNDIE